MFRADLADRPVGHVAIYGLIFVLSLFSADQWIVGVPDRVSPSCDDGRVLPVNLIAPASRTYRRTATIRRGRRAVGSAGCLATLGIQPHTSYWADLRATDLDERRPGLLVPPLTSTLLGSVESHDRASPPRAERNPANGSVLA